MNGIHEVRGSIPLGSTNIINQIGRPNRTPYLLLCATLVDALATVQAERPSKIQGCRLATCSPACESHLALNHTTYRRQADY